MKQLSKDVQLISYKQLENEAKTNVLTKAKDENSQKSKKLHSHASSSKNHDSLAEESLRINEYYKPPPRRNRRREQESPREVRVDLPHFHGKENIEACLDWEMMVEQLFASHKVRKERKMQEKRSKEEDERKTSESEENEKEKKKEIEKPSEGLCESRKNEEYLTTSLASLVKKESLDSKISAQAAT